MNNHALRINGETSIIHQASRKLMWLSLPELLPINKYYTKSNFVQVIHSHDSDHGSDSSMIVIDKNCVNFLTVNLPPLSLGLFKQTFLDWEPRGGLCLSSVLILFDKHTINFYERTQNMKKTWTIEVMQEISQIQSSPQQKVIGMTVTEKDNTIFLWNLHDISNKPFQEVTVSEKIVKWEFYTKDMLIILTSRQLQVYYPRDGQYNLQFFVEMAHLAIDFCFLDRPKTNEHTGRRSVYPVSILSLGGKIFIYELYDVDKRMKNSLAFITATIQTEQDAKSIICGYESESSEIVLCAETSTNKPFSLTLSSQFVPKQKSLYLPELPTAKPSLIQYCKQIICTQDQQKMEKNKQQMKEFKQQDNKDNFRGLKLYKLFRIIGKQQFSFIEQFQTECYGILGGYNFFSFNKDSLIVYPKANNFARESKIVINDLKPIELKLLQEKDKICYFLGGVKIYRLDLNAKMLKAHSFTVKNDRFKFVEVRNQTRSILYKSGQEYVLMEYQTPEHAENQSEKVTVKTIKSSVNKLISLRNNRWVEKLPEKLIIGQANNVLIEFDLLKLFKMLTQENTFLDYQIYWTTHDGMILMLKNYLFVLELIQSPDGYSVSLIKRSNNYLHCRFSPDSQGVQLMDARSITVREGKRVIRFGTKLGNFVSEDPYALPDTILRRQLLMRKIYAPHHPKVIQYLIQLGYFGLLEKMFAYLWKWLTEGGKMKSIYQSIGVQFLRSHTDKISEKAISPPQDLDGEPILKSLCQKILQSPQDLLLQENGGLILESQIEAIIFRQENSRALDFFSQVVISQFKTYETKNHSFKTMHIAYMLHSINKEEAVGILRQELQGKDLNWDWMKKYSLVLWYDAKTQIKNWAEEIGTNLFKVSKEPLDCLFWYTIAGKKNVLIQLFKKYLYNTSEHQKIFKFLQRDFSETKNQNAAVNNAYVLMDKKRYEHALSFFIYGQKIDEAVSLCLNKLKDLNLAFLICCLSQDNTNRNKLIDTMLKEGDVWAKHIAYFYKNQHIDSFNCLFEEENIEKSNSWAYDPKLTNFHPCLKQFAQMIQKSIPIKRQLQQQQMKNTNANSNDIFQSFFGNETQPQVEQKIAELKSLSPNYEWVKKESVLFFMRNSCSILALVIQPQNRKARRAYDLCHFLLTNELNATVTELIQEMEDYFSLIEANLKDKNIVIAFVAQFNQKFKKALQNFRLSDTVIVPKAKIGQIMHYGYLGKRILKKLIENQLQKDVECINNLKDYIQAAKILLVLELEWFQNFQTLANSIIVNFFEPEKLDQSIISLQFWTGIKALYDKITEPKKNKKQNLYDAFEQSLYKYTFKKGDMFIENNNLKLPIQNSISIFIKKSTVSNFLQLFLQRFGQNSDKTIVKTFRAIKKKIQGVLGRWTEEKLQDQLQKELTLMMNEGVVSKLKLTHLPSYLQQKFQPFCRGSLGLRSKIKKNISGIRLKSKISSSQLEKTDIIQIFRNKQEAPKFFAINKNQGQGMELALLTKRGVKKLQICDSLVNRNRSQDGIFLVHDENYFNIDNHFDFQNMFNNDHLPLIQRFLREVVDNRKQYDGVGVIKGSTKRSSPEYFKQLDPLPFFQPSDISSIECHHFLPIYLLGTKSAIELCSFSNNSSYNRIKCTGMSEIVKVRSYEQRVSALDSNGNLGGFSFDAKISGNPVFSLKKASVVDFCLMNPSTYGLCTNNSIQVVDSLLHPKRQLVFKAQSSQTPVAIEYFSSNKLAVCRRNELMIYDTRMDTLLETRDLGGKAKCMSSNYRNKILVGKMDNKIKIFDVASAGPQNDYEIKMTSGRVGSEQQAEKSTIQDIQIMGKFAIALNSEGSIGLFNIQ